MKQTNSRGGRRLDSTGSSSWKEQLQTWLQQGKNRRIVIIVAAVLAAILCVAAAWVMIVRPPELPSPMSSDGMTGDETLNEGDAPSIAASGRKKNCFTFLVCGRDTGGGGNTDVIMLASYDVDSQKASVMSIPRDTMVNVSWDIKRINSVYNMKGLDGLKEHVGKLTGIIPDYYVIIEWEAVGKLVETVGGVTFDVPFDMNYDDPAQDLHIHQTAGVRKLSGDDAMQVVRWRKNNTGPSQGDIQRIGIQQDFLMAVAKETMKLSNLGRIDQFAKIFSENVETDLSMGNLVWFGTKAISMTPEEDLHFYTMPGNTGFSYYSRTYGNMQSYVLPDAQGIVDLINEGFNPYLRDLTTKDIQVIVKNEDGTLGVTSGTLADTKAGQVTARPSSTPKPSAEPSAEPTPTPVPETPQPTEEPTPTVPPESSPEPTPSAPVVTPEATPEPEPTQPPETDAAES